MDGLMEVVQNPVFLATVTASVVTALEGDWDAFQKFDSFGDVKQYQWGRALWRAIKGLAIGVVTGLGAIGVTGGLS